MVDTPEWGQPRDEDGPVSDGQPGSLVNLHVRPVLLTLEEAAEVLRIGRTRMFALVGRGEVRSVRIGSSRRVPMAAIEEYVERLLGAADGVVTRPAV